MKQGRISEMILGSLVLLAAASFLVYGAQVVGILISQDRYRLTAQFADVGGLREGTIITTRGVSIGRIEAVVYDPDSQLAKVSMMIQPEISLSEDTVAEIVSSGVLGGTRMRLLPGSEEKLLKDGDLIARTKEPQSLEDLIGRSLFLISEIAVSP